MIKTKIRCLGKAILKDDITPEYITFFVTNRCNMRCSFCFYSSELNKPVDELTTGEIQTVSSKLKDFAFLSLTGGEPFIRNDIPFIVQTFYDNNRLRYLSLMTNGFLTDKLVSDVQRIVRECPKLNVRVYMSVDDIGERHDSIRNTLGAFSHVFETNEALMDLPVWRNIILTYSGLSSQHAGETYAHIKNHFKPHGVNVNYVRGCVGPYIYPYFDLLRRVEKDYPAGGLLKKFKTKANRLMVKTLVERKYQIPCLAGLVSAVIYPTGDVHACETLKISFGNLRDYDYDFNKMWRERSGRISENILRGKCWCAHGCNMLPNILFNIRAWL